MHRSTADIELGTGSGSVPATMISAGVGFSMTSRPPAGFALGSANGLNRSGPVDAVSSALG